MNTPQPTPDDINAAINTAARRMTSGAPSSDLRARVMSRIDSFDNRVSDRVTRPRWGLRLVFAGGAIASIAVVVAMQLASPKMPTGLISPKPTPEASAKADPTATHAPSSPVLSTASVERTTTRRAAIAVNAAEQTAHEEWLARGLPALEQPAAPTIDALEHPVVGIEAIDITPLNVAPLTVPAQGSNNGSSNK